MPERTSDGVYLGKVGPSMGPRLFGGQAVAQALLAAGEEEDTGRLPHSLHAYFLKAGSSEDPVEYRVTSLSAGRSFATRLVEAFQDNTLIFSMIASFQLEEMGFAHQVAPAFELDIDAARSALDTWRENNPKANSAPIIERLQKRPIELVPLDPGAIFGSKVKAEHNGVWMRMREPAHASPIEQRGLMAYASDMMLLRNALLPHGVWPGSSTVQAASLDHAIWFHETPDFDRWHLFVTDSPWAGYARGLNRGHFYDIDGRMVASVTQESLMRPRGEIRERMLAAEGEPETQQD